MRAPKCTCRMEINEPRSHEVYGVLLPEEWRVKVFLCPLHEAAPDLYTSLEMLLSDAEAYWHQTLAGSPAAIQMARAALLKANPQRTQEEKDDAR